MNDLPTQLWHHQQKRKKGLWSILSKASEAKDALDKAKKARETAKHWDDVADQKVAALHHEASKQYEDKDE